MRFSGLALACVLSACSKGRVSSAYPANDPCLPRECGGVINVLTELAPGTPLTSAECAEACSLLWCDDQTPPAAAGTPGCALMGNDDAGKPTVTCGSYAADCGHCWFPCTTASECGDAGFTSCTNGCCSN